MAAPGSPELTAYTSLNLPSEAGVKPTTAYNTKGRNLVQEKKPR